MSICTAPGCDHPATIQWQRTADQVEADHAADNAAATQARIHKHRLTTATLHLIQTRQQHADALDAAQAGDHRARAVLPTIAEHVAAAEADVERLETDGPTPLPDPGVVTVAVYSCTPHATAAFGDDVLNGCDALTWTHQVGCFTDPPGHCGCTQPAE